MIHKWLHFVLKKKFEKISNNSQRTILSCASSESLVASRQVVLSMDICPFYGRFFAFTRRKRTNHRLGIGTQDFKGSQNRPCLRLAENPGSNRNREPIHSSRRRQDSFKNNAKNGKFADFGIRHLSQYIVFFNRVKTNTKYYQESLQPQFCSSIECVLVLVAIFEFRAFIFAIFQRRRPAPQWHIYLEAAHSKPNKK